MPFHSYGAPLLLAALLTVLAPGLAPAQPPASLPFNGANGLPGLTAVRVASPPHLDGVLDEEQWQGASPATDFRQSEPYEGQPATERTEVRLLFDAENLYIGVRCFDRTPGGVLTNALKEDFDPKDADYVQVILDTYHDQRSGFLFTTNPYGAKQDAQVFDEGRTTNTDWDTIWSVRATIDDQGWTAEIAIPFRSLSFDQSRPEQVWGVNFSRKIRRKNEIDFWAPVPRRYDISRLSMAGRLEGLNAIERGRNLRIKPFVIADVNTLASRGTTEFDPDAGLDVKYSVTPSLTLDLTVNTDFSQVEVDEQQINITRFPVIFPEKREFFLENSGTFQFGDVPGERGPDRAKETQLFFSRRIGLFPDGHPRAGEPIPIRGGARLSGRIGRYNLGVMSLQTASVDDNAATAANEALPSNNFTIVRLKRDVLANSDIGAVFVSRQATDGRDFNRAVGVDANIRPTQNLSINGYVARSATDNLACKPACGERTEKLGFNYRDNRFRFQGIYANIEEGFNAEVGIKGVPTGRTSARSIRGTTEVHMRPPRNRILREVNPHARYFVIYDRENASVYQEGHFTPAELFFHNGARFEFSYNPRIERLDRPFVVPNSPGLSIPVGKYEYGYWQFETETDASKPMFATVDASLGEYYTGTSKSVNVSGTYRPNFRLSAQATLVNSRVSLQGVEYTTRVVRTRLNYSVSTRLFLNALIQYNSARKQLTSNVRLDFIHRPLSNIFLVFNEARDTSGAGRHDRALTVKYTHMLAF